MLYRRYFSTINTNANLPVWEDLIKLNHLTPSEGKQAGWVFPTAMTSLDNVLKSRNITLPTKAHIIKAMVIARSHVLLWELDHKESWALKNWCFWTVVLEKTLESLLDCKAIQPVHPKGDQSWVFIRRTDAEAEAPILWPPDSKSSLTGKDPDARKDWGQEEKGAAEDDMVR